MSLFVYLGLSLIIEWKFERLDAPYFSPVFILGEVLDGSTIHYHEWFIGMGAWLMVSMMMVMASLYLFYRNKMQDH